MQYKEAKGGYKELANSIYRDSCHIRKATKCIGCTLMFSEREIISIIFYCCDVHFNMDTVQAFDTFDYRGYFNTGHCY